ncbi:hypothetical protein EDC50_3135 [Vulcaniibacterium tengchongense]|uniref:Uncharacterized protein n=1 Tax=Vulcaniibacterium tengchongense TaxID=1273429 RepID=A0A3N4UXK0_9GAMM|nr:hypothetical protein EDC50_3135 [Vulcaniibacterium tengchongense]
MTDIVLQDIDPLLLDRIRRVAAARGWSLQEASMHLLEHGLFACEAELAARFNDSDAAALREAIAALEGIPSDPGFSLIGRVERPADVQTPPLEAQGPTELDRELLRAFGQAAGAKG